MPDGRPPRWYAQPLMAASIALHLVALGLLIVVPGYWRWLLALVAGNHALVAAVGLWPRSHWLGANWTQLPAAATARREVALTIDDGPDPEVTPQVLDLLDQHGVQASFFCVGDKAQRYPELCREIVRRGHTVENHTQHHRHNFSVLGMGGMRRELQAAQDTFSAITGQRPVFFRAPAGLRNPFLDPVLSQLGLTLASWSVRAFDTRIGAADQVRDKLLRGLRPGAILLLHDGHAARTATGEAVILAVLPALFEAATAARLRFVTLRHALR